jgi:hypothetical protein
MNYDILVGIGLGALVIVLGIWTGYRISWNSFRRSSMMIDNVYHDKAPFDEELVNEESLDSHVDGVRLDEEE